MSGLLTDDCGKGRLQQRGDLHPLPGQREPIPFSGTASNRWICELLQSVLYQFNRLSGEEQTRQMLRRSNDEFPKSWTTCTTILMSSKLLFTSGENNAYQEFIHRVVELDTGCTAQYIEASGNDAVSSGRLTPELNSPSFQCLLYGNV